LGLELFGPRGADAEGRWCGRWLPVTILGGWV